MKHIYLIKNKTTGEVIVALEKLQDAELFSSAMNTTFETVEMYSSIRDYVSCLNKILSTQEVLQ